MNCFLIAAQTVDGFIAERNDQVSTAWTSGADKKWFSQRTKEAGVVVMGASTFRTINRALPGRLTVVYTRNPQEFAQFDPSEVMTTQATPAELLKELIERGFREVAICGGASIYSLFLRAGLIDRLYLTIEPVLFGQGVGLFQEKTATKLKLESTTKLADDTLLLEYLVDQSK